MNGASTRSAAASEYPRLSGERAKRSMNMYPTRVPKPVWVTARENRKAVKTSQTVMLAKPDRTLAGGSVPVTASRVIAIRTLTPIRTGCTTSATTVAKKIAKSRSWGRLMPGSGRK